MAEGDDVELQRTRTPESARTVMETYTAADLSADRNEPVNLPLTNQTISQIAEFKQKIRAGLNT